MEIREVLTRQDWKLFFKLPFSIFKNDPYWVPPLLIEQRRTLDREKNPYFAHCNYKAWLILDGREALGRILAYVDSSYNELYREQAGFLGFFESRDDPDVSSSLFDKALEWLRQHGLDKVYGPMNFSIANECGILLTGFDSPPFMQMNHTPPYYRYLFEKAGFSKAHDLYAYLMTEALVKQNRALLQRMQRISEKTLQKEGVRFRTVNLKKYHAELSNINTLFNDFMKDTWGFVPSSLEEMYYVGETLKQIVDPEMIFFAEIKDKVVGCSLSIPDINTILIHMKGRLDLPGILKWFYYKRKIKSFRLLMLGVTEEYRRKGLDILFYYYTIQKGLERGYTKSELSWISEDNAVLISIVEKIGAIRYKTYRIYEKSM